MKIAIDALGGDNAPVSNIKGAFSYLSKNNDEEIDLVLIGNESVINKIISENKYNKYLCLKNILTINKYNVSIEVLIKKCIIPLE